MLIKIPELAACLPKIRKTTDGRDVSDKGNFACGERIEFTVEAPRSLGASAVVLRICRDGGEDADRPFDFVSTEYGIDVYRLLVDTRELCGDKDSGLFFYEILFLRGTDTLFTSTVNNVDMIMTQCSDRRFKMLVYKKDFKTPNWFKGRTMYQIFPDRFFKGSGYTEMRTDSIMNDDWYGGTPQYAEHPGEDLKNNMFFGGNLWGIAEKLKYLKSMGVGVIYLNPIFEAYSNHKYDTGDYRKTDAAFGGDAALAELIKKANEEGIRIILDGVFNHTGDNSLYFDRYGEYGGVGAYENENSVYRDWYNFDSEGGYESWWGIKILPRLNHKNKACRRFFTGSDGIGAWYIKKGISGWRLDVADELSDEFLDEFNASVKRESEGEALIIGEVWENAAEKISYGKRRSYLLGSQLDSVMNYPLKNGILEYVMGGSAENLADVLKSIYSVYPKQVCDSLMNILGTHDTERVLTVLGRGNLRVSDEAGSVLAEKRLSRGKHAVAVKRLLAASAIQFTVYGVPSVYYGDEAGLEGYRDPFCRFPYPWGKENKKILAHYKRLGSIREENRELFAEGEFKVLCASGGLLVYTRYNADSRLTVAVNNGKEAVKYKVRGKMTDLLTDMPYMGSVPPCTCVILKRSGD